MNYKNKTMSYKEKWTLILASQFCDNHILYQSVYYSYKSFIAATELPFFKTRIRPIGH